MIRVGIIGGGFYGLFIASYLTHKGYYVRVLDTNQPKASEVCQARLHNGMFYSRSLSDLKCCINNGATFYKWYRDFIIKDFNSYYLVDKNSNVVLFLSQFLTTSAARALSDFVAAISVIHI